ncbi:MAG TPA: lanthionine synthetase LanC family protein [Candidatus Acidoferrales bacterium]|nr:lanthionine synthetase LanC family protein [Candidatus Acidoferrales bacterium]
MPELNGHLPLLKVAEEIGRRICAEAIWHEDRCNWIGAEAMERPAAGQRSTLTYRTLGPDLYSGAGGVAIFLAELYGVTGEPALRRTATAAIRQALSRADTVSPGGRIGLFSGWTGIALAAVRLAAILGEPVLVEEAMRLVRRAAGATCDPREYDVMSGRAGAIASLVVLHCILDDISLLELAVRFGDELLASAERSDAGFSWESSGAPNHRNLTGFSHGAAGAAYALLELFSATGDGRYREAALRAFDYERHWFNAREGNWPDFRKDPSSGRKKPRTHPHMVFWCHGAPGIALSRLRAWEILNDGACKAEAIAALRTTRASLEQAVDGSAGNFSLCHGLPGNAESLLYAAEVLGAEGASVAAEIAAFGAERYSDGRSPWPCGTYAGETPGFMLGLAGIGYFYLRLCRPSVPGLLVLRKEQWQPAGRG